MTKLKKRIRKKQLKRLNSNKSVEEQIVDKANELLYLVNEQYGYDTHKPSIATGFHSLDLLVHNGATLKVENYNSEQNEGKPLCIEGRFNPNGK